MTEYTIPEKLPISPALKPINFTIYRGTFLHTPNLNELQVFIDARIGVDSNGVIQYICTGELSKGNDATIQECLKLKSNKDIIDLNSESITVVDESDKGLFKFFIPGFIDTHIHAPQYPNIGVFGDSTLFDWLIKYTYPLEKQLEDCNKAFQVYDKVVKKTLNHGTTFCAYYSTIYVDSTNVLTDCCLMNGQRAYIGRSCQDCGRPDYKDENLKDGQLKSLKIIEHVKKRDLNYDIVKPILTPRNANKLTHDYMYWLSDVAKSENLPIQAHMSETDYEVDDILLKFPDCKNYAEIYDKFGLLRENTILGHCIFIDKDEIELIKKRKSTISHCPTSNSCLTSGEFKARWLLDNEVTIGLGSDISGGYSASILTTARHAHMVSRHVSMKTKKDEDKLSVNETIYLATLGGANTVGMGDKLGTFTKGKKFDVQLIDLFHKDSQIDEFEFLNPDLKGYLNGNEEDIRKFQDSIDKWLFNGDDRNVRKVWVNGRCVVNKEVDK